MSTFGSRLKESREKKGLLQSELAKMIGVKSSGVISNWEQDINKPNADKMIEICQALGISLSYLLDYYGEEKTPFYSSEAMKLAADYDKQLDTWGQKQVRAVTDNEIARCIAESVALREKQKMPTLVSEDGQDDLEEFVRIHKANLAEGQRKQILEMMQAMITPRKSRLSASAQAKVDGTSPKTEDRGQS